MKRAQLQVSPVVPARVPGLPRRAPARRRPVSLAVAATLALLATERMARADCGRNNQAPCGIWSHPGLNVKGFADDFADSMIGLVKGYGITVRDRDGKAVLYMSSGTALEAADNGGTSRRFSSTTKSGIGSVSKVLTEGAVRHAIELNQRGPAYASCRVDLDTPFLDLLPAVYRDIDNLGAEPGFYRDVTVRQILQHTSGMPNYLPPDPVHGFNDINDEPGDGWLQMDRTGIDYPNQCRKGAICYTNVNYAVATTMLPAILDCDFRQDLEDYVEWACDSLPFGRHRQSCELQRAFDVAGQISNGIVEEMILDRVGVEAACDAADLVDRGYTTARGYPNSWTAQGGWYPGAAPYPNSRGCGVGGWHMSSRDLGSAIRFMHEGTFFLDPINRLELPDWHNGGIPGAYSALVHELGGGLRASFEANSPINTFNVTALLDQAYDRNDSLALWVVSSNIVEASRGDWKCTRNGDRAPMMFQAYGTADVAAYHRNDFGGVGSKEVWKVASQTNTQASGTYVYYPANESPLGSRTWTGTWQLSRTNATSLSITRRDDATGWTGTYRCTR